MKTPPGFKQSWINMLPAPWDQDPHVVVVMVPTEAKFAHRESSDKTTVFGCLEHNNNSYGLQILRPMMNSYEEHRKVFNSHGADMARPAFIGYVSEIPQKLMMSNDFIPLLFRTQHMSDEFLNVRAAGLGMTTRINN